LIMKKEFLFHRPEYVCLRRGLLFVILALCMALARFPEETFAVPVRIKDMGKIIEARDNQLIGFGLVVGLQNTGDSRGIPFTDIALENTLSKMGIYPGGRELGARNVASVLVTATLPPFVKKGQRISVLVSAIGDSASLVGGTLIMTPLKGADLETYAVAQGSILVGGIQADGGQVSYIKNKTTVGRIPNGAIIEKEVSVTFLDQHNITLVLHSPNFITASRAVTALQQNGFPNAQAIDANTIKIPLSDLESSDLVATIAAIENIKLEPDSSSKVVINSRTGTVVIGEMVRLFPVALTHGNISVKISTATGGGFGAVQQEPPLNVQENESKLVYLNPSATLASLVNALNEIGATPKDLISIIQALYESGALVGIVEII